jgi:hypothetical protein
MENQLSSRAPINLSKRFPIHRGAVRSQSIGGLLIYLEVQFTPTLTFGRLWCLHCGLMSMLDEATRGPQFRINPPVVLVHSLATFTIVDAASICFK